MKEANVEELARRAVACKHWRWMPGMRVQYVEYGTLTDGFGRFLGHGTQPGDYCIQWDDYAPRGVAGSSWSTPQNFRPSPHIDDVAIPDLTDPATLGCFIALVREATGQPYVIGSADDVPTLVAVLEAAP